MTNQVYYTARQRLMTAQFNWTTGTFQLVAFHGTPAFFAADTTIAQHIAHTAGVAERGRSLPFAGLTVTSDGVAQSGPVVIPGIVAGMPEITHMILAINAALPANATPILFLDTITGVPFEPNGLDVTVQPDWTLQRGWWVA